MEVKLTPRLRSSTPIALVFVNRIVTRFSQIVVVTRLVILHFLSTAGHHQPRMVLTGVAAAAAAAAACSASIPSSISPAMIWSCVLGRGRPPFPAAASSDSLCLSKPCCSQYYKKWRGSRQSYNVYVAVFEHGRKRIIQDFAPADFGRTLQTRGAQA